MRSSAIAAPLVGLFPFITMFVVTSITMLRERTTGTLERLMAMPLAKLDLLLGYGIAFAVVGVIQALVTSFVAFGLLGLDVAGSTVVVIVTRGSRTPCWGCRWGCSSAPSPGPSSRRSSSCPPSSSRSFCSVVSSSPVTRWRRRSRPSPYALPLTYAFDALDRVANEGSLGTAGALDVVVICAVTVLSLALGAATLRRRTP